MGVTNSCKYFNVGCRKENILHGQFRNYANTLNAHLKSHFLSDVQLCGKCGYYIEDTKHYFTKCPYFKNINILWNKLKKYWC